MPAAYCLLVVWPICTFLARLLLRPWKATICVTVLSHCHLICLSGHRKPCNVSWETVRWLICRYLITVCLFEAVLAVYLHHSSALVGRSLLHVGVLRSRSVKHTSVDRTPLDEWLALRRGPYLRAHHLQETDFHAPGGMRTRNPSKRVTVDPRLRPRDHRDRLSWQLMWKKNWFFGRNLTISVFRQASPSESRRDSFDPKMEVVRLPGRL